MQGLTILLLFSSLVGTEALRRKAAVEKINLTGELISDDEYQEWADTTGAGLAVISGNVGLASDPVVPGDYIDDGLAVVEGAKALATNPGLKATGGFLSGLSLLAMVFIPPPAGIVIGGGLALIGGLISLFAPAKGTSNKDLLDAMADGFDKIGAALSTISYKLDRMVHKLDTIQNSVLRVEQKLDELDQLFRIKYKSDLFAPIRTVHARYKQAMGKLAQAARYPNEQSYMNDFRSFVKQQEHDIGSFRGNELSVANMRTLLQLTLDCGKAKEQCGTRCAAIEVYHEIVAARFELFEMALLGTAFSPPDGSDIVVLDNAYIAEEYIADMKAYENAFVRTNSSSWSIDSPEFTRRLIRLTEEERRLGESRRFKISQTGVKGYWDTYPSAYISLNGAPPVVTDSIGSSSLDRAVYYEYAKKSVAIAGEDIACNNAGGPTTQLSSPQSWTSLENGKAVCAIKTPLKCSYQIYLQDSGDCGSTPTSCPWPTCWESRWGQSLCYEAEGVLEVSNR